MRVLLWGAVAAMLWSGTAAEAARLAVNPTTTLAAEKGNNTSAADGFAGQTNGNLGAGNVSKEPISKLLYAGANTRVYVHLMAWWGSSSHVSVGYKSDDPVQVRRQVDDMLSRGIQGAIVDWYGPLKHENPPTIALRAEAELRGGAFEFAITEDVGALLACANTAGCNLSQQVVSDLTYAYNNFMVSPAYMRWNGRPVVFFFGLEKYTLDWNLIRAGVPGNPLFIFRNSGAFTHTQTDGGFSWVGISGDALNMGLGYLDNFYSTALKYPVQLEVGSTYKGFNDSIASWAPSPPRVVSQQCGQTWLSTFSELRKYYSANTQLPMLQLVTWNDYEEGTSLESGIDNCVSVAASLSGSTLNWTLTGDQRTVDHFTVFISLDGQNLMRLADAPASARSLSLAGYELGPAQYTLYVKAVGQPSFSNRMSAAVSYALANQPPVASVSANPTTGPAPLQVTATTSASADADGAVMSSSIDFGDGAVMPGPIATHTYSTGGGYTITATVTDDAGAKSTATVAVSVAAPDLNLSATPSEATVSTGQSGSYQIRVAPTATWGQAVTLSCAGLPQFASCNFAPASLNVGSSAVTSSLSISTGTLSASTRPGRGLPWMFLGGSPAIALVGLVFVGDRGRRAWMTVLIVVLAGVCSMAGCGSGGQATQIQRPRVSSTPPGSYNITVTAVSGSVQRSTQVVLKVQ